MCQQCIRLGLATPINRKGTVAVVRKEKKAETEDDNKRGRGKR